MTQNDPTTTAALTTYLATPPTVESATAFQAAIGKADPASICKALAAKSARAHLEALAETAAEKSLKKAARAAAYKLKSAGIAGEFRTQGGIDLTPTVTLDRIGIAYAPTLGGAMQLLVGSLPGAAGGWIDFASNEQGASIDPEMTAGRIHKRAQESAAARGIRVLAPVHADVAARIIEVTAKALEVVGRAKPAAYPGFLTWAERARTLGADPERANARATIAPTPTTDAPTILFEHKINAPAAVPDELGEELDRRLGPELHSDAATDEAAFCARVEEAGFAALDAWWAEKGAKDASTMMLDLGADVHAATGDPETAAIFLGVSDALTAHEGAARDSAVLAAWIRRLVNPKSAWKHRLAHIEGHAHH